MRLCVLALIGDRLLIGNFRSRLWRLLLIELEEIGVVTLGESLIVEVFDVRIETL